MKGGEKGKERKRRRGAERRHTTINSYGKKPILLSTGKKRGKKKGKKEREEEEKTPRIGEPVARSHQISITRGHPSVVRILCRQGGRKVEKGRRENSKRI